MTYAKFCCQSAADMTWSAAAQTRKDTQCVSTLYFSEYIQAFSDINYLQEKP